MKRLKTILLVFGSIPLWIGCEVEDKNEVIETNCIIQTTSLVGGEDNFEFVWAFNCSLKSIQVRVLNGFGQEIKKFVNIDDLRAFDLQNLQPPNEQNLIYYWLAEFETEENPGFIQNQRGKFTYLADK